MIISMSTHGANLAVLRAFPPAPRQAHLPTSGPTTTSPTALLTRLLTDAPSNSTPNRTICAKSSRARRNLHPSIGLRPDSPEWSHQKSWGLRLNWSWEPVGPLSRVSEPELETQVDSLDPQAGLVELGGRLKRPGNGRHHRREQIRVHIQIDLIAHHAVVCRIKENLQAG